MVSVLQVWPYATKGSDIRMQQETIALIVARPESHDRIMHPPRRVGKGEMDRTRPAAYQE